MGRLIKYEFRKQLLSKLIVGLIILVLEVMFALGLFLEKEYWLGLAMGLLIFVAFASLFYFSFESIVTYSNDLRTKHSYMLFLTPCNMFEIVGAKLLTTVIQIFLTGCIMAAIAIGDVFLICAKFGAVEELLRAIKEFFQLFTGVEVRLIEVVYVLLMLLITWLVFVAMAIFAITLSTTLLSNWKFKGIVSVIIYFVLDWGVAKIAGLVVSTGFLQGEYLVVNTDAWAYIGVYIVALALSYVGTALLLDKKVSV